MDIFARIAEAKIREAMERGEFDNLPGLGKPLKLDDLSHVPEEWRPAYIILKNSGFLPEEAQVKKEIYNLRQQIKACLNDEEKDALKKEMLALELKHNILMEKMLKRRKR